MSGGKDGGAALATRDDTQSGTGGEILDLKETLSSLEAITRAEIDIQITTAKRYPRSPERFLRDAQSLIAASPEVAESCRYSLPARKGRDGKTGDPIEGPSVRMAEIVACSWGNLRISGRIIDDDGRLLTAQGLAIDLERNVGYTVEATRNVIDSRGRRYTDDMIRMTRNALIAIATRNVTFKVVPRAMVAVLEEKAIAIVRGTAETLPKRIANVLDYCARKGIAAERVYETLGIVGQADITVDHLVELHGWLTAIKDGHATAAEVFAPRAAAAAAEGASKAEALASRIGHARSGTKEVPPDDAEPEEPGSRG